MKAVTAVNTIATDGRIILLDESLLPEKREAVKNLETVDCQELVFLEDQQLAVHLELVLKDILHKNTLLVFPGNGANYPRKLSQICYEFPNTASVEAKRFWVPSENPEVNVGLIYPDRFLILGVKHVVIVDDVISSGLTMRKIYQKNAWRFPGANWHACAWISQLLSGGGIHGYSEVSTGCLVRKENGTGKVAVNSLSTLRNNHEVAESYATRHFKEPRRFLHLIKKD